MNICSSGQKNKYELSTKERLVLFLMKEGFNNSQISEKLQNSKDAVQEYIRKIFFKLKAQNRVQAVTNAVKENII